MGKLPKLFHPNINRNFYLITLLFFACKTNENKAPSPSMPGKPSQFIGQSLETESLALKLIKVENGLASLEIVNLENENGLECLHNGEKITNCARKFQINLFPGKNIFEVYKKTESKILGFADLIVQQGFDSANIASWTDALRSRDPLFLVPSQSGYKDGVSHDRTKDFVFEFKLARSNDCNPVFKCSYDQRDPSYWRVCSELARHTVPAELIAKGIQFLHVRAECGATIGPTLSTHFYGVQKEYSWLSLDRFRIGSTNEDIFLLEKSNDCPESLLKFECVLESNASSFVSCKNRHNRVQPSFKIRAVCDSKPGPVHVVL